MNRKSIIFLRIAIGISIILSLLFAFMFFLHKREVSYSLRLDNDSVGQYGDFIGGVLGTLLSVVLLYYTLHLQRHDSNRNAKIFEKQELNNDFYHLLSLYQDILRDFAFQADGIEMRGKELLAHRYKEYYEEIDEDTKSLRNAAKRTYLQFYADNRHFAPVYFRTLYRICEAIDGKERETDYKNVSYIKILRAQLTDAEMLLLRYNAQSIMGKPFRYYINRMNILKHLPPFELLEYKKWHNKLSRIGEHEVSSMNTILIELRQRIAELLDKDNHSELSTFTEAHSIATFAIRVTKEKDELTMVLNRRNANLIPKTDLFGCLLRFSSEELQELFAYFLYDSIVLMNFSQFNIRRELDFTSRDESPADNSRVTLSFSVKNRQHKRISMKWSHCLQSES